MGALTPLQCVTADHGYLSLGVSGLAGRIFIENTPSTSAGSLGRVDGLWLRPWQP